MKKIFNLVLGLFMICTLLFGISSAVSNLGSELSALLGYEALEQDSSEMFEQEVLQRSAENLNKTLDEILILKGVDAADIELFLEKQESGSIIISKINIHINTSLSLRSDEIKQITEESLGIIPNVIILEEKE